MKRIMIVDDEFFVRIGIKSMVDWEENGYTIVCEAANGQDAIEKIARFSPQIVLTDLVMEPINGLELIEHCSKAYPGIKFIVLSNYNDFEKVRAAMKLGARDYLFKLTANPEELLSIMNAVSQEIDSRTPPGGDAELLLNRNFSAIRQRLIQTVAEQSYINEEEILKELRLVEVKTDFHKPYAVLYLSVANYDVLNSANTILEPNLFAFSMENIVSEIMCERFTAQTFNDGNGNCLVVVNVPEELEMDDLYGMLTVEYARSVKCIARYFGVKVNGALSDITTGIKNFAGCVALCKKAISRRFNQAENILFYRKHIPACQMKFAIPEEYGMAILQEYLEYYCFEDSAAFIRKIMQYFYGAHEVETHLVRGKIYEMYQVFKRDAEMKGIPLDEIVDSYKLPLYQGVFRYDLLSSIEDSFLDILGQYAAECKKLSGKKIRKEIVKVIGYVKDNLKEDLGVATAARLVHMSESYFSHLFKMEMGISFVDYVNRLRIEKARELLAGTDLKIYEVAYAVGIDNPNYFSVLFKKLMGRSPNDCRNN